MTLEDLKIHPAFVTLSTDQQRAFVLAYCSNGGDKVAAAEAAYTANDKASAVAIANRNMRHPAIKRLVGDYYGLVDETGTRDQFLALLWKKVQGGPGIDDRNQLQWAALYMKVKGYETAKAPAIPQDSPDNIDDLVRALEANEK